MKKMKYNAYMTWSTEAREADKEIRFEADSLDDAIRKMLDLFDIPRKYESDVYESDEWGDAWEIATGVDAIGNFDDGPDAYEAHIVLSVIEGGDR